MIGKMKLYSCIVFFHEDMKRRPVKYRKVSNIERFKKFAHSDLTGWLYFNYYDRESRQYIGRVRNEYLY